MTCRPISLLTPTLPYSPPSTRKQRGGDEGDYVRPWQKRVPIIIRSASSREDLDGLRCAGTGVGLGAGLGTDPGPPPKRLHAECQDWVARNVLTPGGALRPAAADCLALVYHGAAGGPADHAPGVGAPDGALARPTVLKGPAIRALAGRMRRVVLEFAVQQVLAEGTEDAVKLEPGGAAQRRPSTLTGECRCAQSRRLGAPVAGAWSIVTFGVDVATATMAGCAASCPVPKSSPLSASPPAFHVMACLPRLPSWVRRLPSAHVTATVCHEPCTARGQHSTTQRCSAQAWAPRPAAIPRGHRVRRCCHSGPCRGPGQWPASPKGTPWAVLRQCRPRGRV